MREKKISADLKEKFSRSRILAEPQRADIKKDRLEGMCMLPEKVKNANIGVGVGFVLEIAGRVMMSAHVGPVLIGAAVTLVGVVAFVWGCFNYSEGKGHSPFLGLLGLLSCLGLIVLLLLPDKYKNGAPPPGSGGTYSSQPGVWPPPPNSPS